MSLCTGISPINGYRVSFGCSVALSAAITVQNRQKAKDEENRIHVRLYELTKGFLRPPPFDSNIPHSACMKCEMVVAWGLDNSRIGARLPTKKIESSPNESILRQPRFTTALLNDKAAHGIRTFKYRLVGWKDLGMLHMANLDFYLHPCLTFSISTCSAPNPTNAANRARSNAIFGTPMNPTGILYLMFQKTKSLPSILGMEYFDIANSCSHSLTE
jgi:hypothetical protein